MRDNARKVASRLAAAKPPILERLADIVGGFNRMLESFGDELRAAGAHYNRVLDDINRNWAAELDDANHSLAENLQQWNTALSSALSRATDGDRTPKG